VRPVAITTKLLTSADLIKLTNDGTVDGWFNSFNGLFKSFGTVASPLPPSQYYEGKLFVSA
jgi:NitT/TauT family transport system substrate-binding protein